jgi:hypothetical protein
MGKSRPALAMLAAFPLLAVTVQAQSALHPVRPASLCVTEGTIEESSQGLSVAVPKMRAYLNTATPPVAELRFHYLGSSGNELPLASGMSRRQIGLKLRARDACNLIYAMWRIEPESKLVVSVKSNPDQHSSAECGNRGYRNLQPTRSAAIPPLRAGEKHTLAAQMDGAHIKVSIDGTVVWQGSADSETLSVDGPVGLRSDNARFLFEFLAPSNSQANSASSCRSGPAEAE